MTDWTLVKHFKREEWIKDPDRVLPDLVYLLDEVRDAAGVPIVIHVAWDDRGHEPDSSHYTEARDLATGVDFHIVGLPLLDQWLLAERFPFSGLGLYPFWQSPGLHGDLRKLGRDHPHLGKRWWREDILVNGTIVTSTYRPFDRKLIELLLSNHAGG